MGPRGRQICLVLLLAAQVCGGKAETIPTFVVAGQSNARLLGFSVGPFGEIPVTTITAPFFQYGDPDGSDETSSDALVIRRKANSVVRVKGAAIANALASVYPDGFALIVYALDATGLDRDWRPTDPAGHYQKYGKEFITAGLAAIAEVSGKSPDLKAFFWHQGEDDSFTSAEAERYRVHLQFLADDIHESFGPVPLIMGEIREVDANDRAINTHIHSVAQHNRLIHVVSTQDLQWNGVHPDLVSLLIAGHRYINVFRKNTVTMPILEDWMRKHGIADLTPDVLLDFGLPGVARKLAIEPLENKPGKIAISYERRANVGDLCFSVEQSDDLVTWTSLDPDAENTAATLVDSNRIRICVQLSPTSRGRYFRLIVATAISTNEATY